MCRVLVFLIFGDGCYMCQLLYVGDFVIIIVSCLCLCIVGQCYNIIGLEKVDYIDIICQIKCSMCVCILLLYIFYCLFCLLLRIWVLFDCDLLFIVVQLQVLVVYDEFEVIDWFLIFNVRLMFFVQVIDVIFNDFEYGDIVLEF